MSKLNKGFTMSPYELSIHFKKFKDAVERGKKYIIKTEGLKKPPFYMELNTDALYFLVEPRTIIRNGHAIPNFTSTAINLNKISETELSFLQNLDCDERPCFDFPYHGMANGAIDELEKQHLELLEEFKNGGV